VTGERFRRVALSFPETTEGSHMGQADFRVRGKIFGTLTDEERRAAMRCDAESLHLLVHRDPETFRDAWRGRWLGIRLASADEREVRHLLEDAWRLVAPKRLVAEYDARIRARPRG
jgi:hypothetical protein